MNKHFIIGLAVVVLTIGGIYVYYQHSEQYPSTDNAYVNSNLVNISPKVGGYVMNIYVKNNQFVHTGDLLVTINPQDYSLMLDKAKQDLEMAKEQEDNALQQINVTKVALNKASADYKFAQEVAKRYADLYKQNAGSLQDMQKYQNQSDAAKQAVNQASH